ncbi:putative membrane protein YhhN [Bacillus tianshenii]|uniref:Membrane protein YhhN n=1 Tax=Sutcliffiella tianshenii TaxID=1463404 RepID=A0ABS2NYK1_9BACI|nr:lysoplasmalogenase [Bacillus tianshenii]MBM7619756.1 putative membrane protein YhhN [Bacillus tianshenii]
MFTILSIFTLISAFLYFFGIKTKNQKLLYLHKPLTMLFIISLAVNGAATSWTAFAMWMIIGLIFSLIGDVFLMLQSDRFLYGLVSFLLAHAFYMVAFLQFPSLGEGNYLLLAMLAVIALLFLHRLHKGVLAQGGKRLFFAVTFYILLISSMVWFSFLTFNPWMITAAILFYFSDAALAWDRFVKPLLFRSYIVMSTYFAAQYLFACTVYFH